MEKPFKSQELELQIDNLAFGGRGVARVDGFVIFVEGALPGDRVRAVVTKARRSFAEALTLEVLEPSEKRIEPACRHFGVCGGCSWQSLAYETQLKFKQRQVNECLQHIGGIEGFVTDEALGAEPLWRYRNKVEFSFAGAPGGGIDLGFHRPGQWWRVVDIEDCLLHSELTNRIRNHVRQFVRDAGGGVFDQRTGEGFWRHLVLKEGTNTGEVMVNVVTAPGDFPRRDGFTHDIMTAFPGIASLVWSVNDTKASVATGFPFQVLAGRDHIFEELCGLGLQVSPASFLQTNTYMAERLYRKALEYAELTGTESVFDLYSGIGSIALLLAGSCREVFGVEIVASAIAMAEANAQANAVGNVRFAAGKVRSVLKNMQPPRHPDLVVLDPPRAGASPKEIQRISELAPSRIVYVSCNASTMAGNAVQLAKAGYRLSRVGAVDMFPHTPHIEVVARFDLTPQA
ncbi:MAG: 23S rRNA (uracil(1939)-C(5))-methyltransferase RlmD [Thermoleophilia bacterium]